MRIGNKELIGTVEMVLEKADNPYVRELLNRYAKVVDDSERSTQLAKVLRGIRDRFVYGH